MMDEIAHRGFELRELRLCGPGQVAGSLSFESGLNVIEGASDTGKSYALSCIDFVMGAGTPPEEIPQARPYDVAYLSIEAADGQFYTLKRALVGGKIGLFRGPIGHAVGADIEWEVLGETTNAKESVSGFLLGLCGLDGRRVRKDDSGTTQEASFRVLSKALIVDEVRIIAKRSPLYGSQNTSNTAAASTIRMLLTVAFDEKTADIVVNGRKRTSHGKGVRAVMCAGYVIGLMQEALAAKSGHPGFVVLDTPLNPYKEADADDDGEVATSVKDAFYRNLCSSSALGQVVVFENVAPPADVQASCNHVHFSRGSAGRYGFLPVLAAP